MKELDGKVALVTGASQNIGREIALALAERGASIVINTRSSVEAAEAVADEVRALGVNAAMIQADISDSADATRLVDAAASQMGRLDFVVLNAAIRRQKPIAEITDQDWREVLGVALDGAFFVSRAAVPHLRKAGGGRFVFLGGTPSHLGTIGRSHVCAAKMGAVGLMRTLATELGPDNITSNTVAPGHIDTQRGAAAGARSVGGSGRPTESSRPIQRRGVSREIASAVAYACSPDAAYMTGQTIHVNGGMYYG